MVWQDTNKYSRNFWLFLVSVTIIRLIVALLLDPAPQEAYYWNYSQHPDLSYFDHPPMAAYLIYLFTGIFGDNAFGIHFSAVFISFILSLVMFYSAKLLFDIKTAFWTVVVGSTTFIFALGGIIITPDGPLLLFWFLMMFAFYQAVSSNRINWWLLTGIFAGAAFISKYPAVLAFIGAFLYMITHRQRRKLFLSIGPYLSLFAFVIVSLPVIIWNYQHDWASFSFQSGRRASEAVAIRADYFFGFLGSQIGVLGVFMMPLFIWGICKAVSKIKDDPRLALFFWFALPTLLVFLLVSPFHYVKMNWPAPAYLSVLPITVYLYFKYASRAWKAYGKFALIFSIAATLIIHVIILLPNIGFGRADTIHGWRELAVRVDEIKADLSDEGELFICGYEYKTASELRFHLSGQPEVYSNNIVGRGGLAYDFWSDPNDLVGQNCIFVYDDRNKFWGSPPLSDFFERVDDPEIVTVERGGKKITDFYIYQCYKYKGIT